MLFFFFFAPSSRRSLFVLSGAISPPPFPRPPSLSRRTSCSQARFPRLVDPTVRKARLRVYTATSTIERDSSENGGAVAETTEPSFKTSFDSSLRIHARSGASVRPPSLSLWNRPSSLSSAFFPPPGRASEDSERSLRRPRRKTSPAAGLSASFQSRHASASTRRAAAPAAAVPRMHARRPPRASRALTTTWRENLARVDESSSTTSNASKDDKGSGGGEGGGGGDGGVGGGEGDVGDGGVGDDVDAGDANGVGSGFAGRGDANGVVGAFDAVVSDSFGASNGNSKRSSASSTLASPRAVSWSSSFSSSSSSSQSRRPSGTVCPISSRHRQRSASRSRAALLFAIRYPTARCARRTISSRSTERPESRRSFEAVIASADVDVGGSTTTGERPPTVFAPRVVLPESVSASISSSGNSMS